LLEFDDCFLMCRKNIEWWLKICTSYLVYSQIWLSFLRDDGHIFYISLWMIAILVLKKLKKTLGAMVSKQTSLQPSKPRSPNQILIDGSVLSELQSIHNNV